MIEDIIIILFILVYSFTRTDKINLILYFVYPTNGSSGPFSLARYIKAAIIKLRKNQTFCRLYSIRLCYRSYISFDSAKNILANKNTIIWFENSLYLNYIHNRSFSSMFMRILYGSCVSPITGIRVL